MQSKFEENQKSQDDNQPVLKVIYTDDFGYVLLYANPGLEVINIGAESCQFFIDCVNQCIMLPIEFVKEFVDFFSDPFAYSANLVKECPSYTPSGNWKRIQEGNNPNQFFASPTNASLCQQIASSSLPQIGQ